MGGRRTRRFRARHRWLRVFGKVTQRFGVGAHAFVIAARTLALRETVSYKGTQTRPDIVRGQRHDDEQQRDTHDRRRIRSADGVQALHHSSRLASARQPALSRISRERLVRRPSADHRLKSTMRTAASRRSKQSHRVALIFGWPRRRLRPWLLLEYGAGLLKLR